MESEAKWSDVPAVIGRPVLIVIMLIAVPWIIVSCIWQQVKFIPLLVLRDLLDLRAEWWRDFKDCGGRFR